jgi:hypothetical protein
VSSTLGGDDPDHDLTPEEKDKIERQLRLEGRELLKQGRAKERKKLDARAVEVSRPKSKKAHQS